MIKIDIVEWATGKVVNSFPVRGAKTVDDRTVNRVIEGVLINMDRDRFGAEAVEVAE